MKTPCILFAFILCLGLFTSCSQNTYELAMQQSALMQTQLNTKEQLLILQQKMEENGCDEEETTSQEEDENTAKENTNDKKEDCDDFTAVESDLVAQINTLKTRLKVAENITGIEPKTPKGACPEEAQCEQDITRTLLLNAAVTQFKVEVYDLEGNPIKHSSIFTPAKFEGEGTFTFDEDLTGTYRIHVKKSSKLADKPMEYDAYIEL